MVRYVFVGRERTGLVGHGGWGFSAGVLGRDGTGWDGMGNGEGRWDSEGYKGEGAVW